VRYEVAEGVRGCGGERMNRRAWEATEVTDLKNGATEKTEESEKKY
jgi:hypothetical protein